MKRTNIIFGLAGCVLSSLIFWETSRFPKDTVMGIGPAFFPRILSIGLFLISASIIVTNFLDRKESGATRFDPRSPGVQRAGISLLITVVYVLLMSFLGFLLSTFIFLVSLMFLMTMRKWWKMLLVSGGVTAAVYVIFRVLLNITLPKGFCALEKGLLYAV